MAEPCLGPPRRIAGWASLVGAAMAIGYSFIALGLSISAGRLICLRSDMGPLPELGHLFPPSATAAVWGWCVWTIITVRGSPAPECAGNTHGTVGGQSLSPSPKAFGVLNALGSVLFAYAFSMILIEIQVRACGRVGGWMGGWVDGWGGV